MANLFGHKPDPKAKVSKNNSFSPERNQDNYPVNPNLNTKRAPLPGLRGILGLGQTINLTNSPEGPVKTGHEWSFNPNHLVTEQKVLFDQKQKELQKEIVELRDELKKLANATRQLEYQVSMAASQPITDVSDYQLNFLQHLKILISNFQKNVSEASVWMEMYQSKKSNKKKGAFWNKVKTNGESYLFSSEHSAARSGT